MVKWDNEFTNQCFTKFNNQVIIAKYNNQFLKCCKNSKEYGIKRMNYILIVSLCISNDVQSGFLGGNNLRPSRFTPLLEGSLQRHFLYIVQFSRHI